MSKTKALVPELRFPEFRGGGEWKSEKLSQLAKPVKGKASELEPEDVLTLSGEHGLVRQTEYFGKKVAGADLKRYLRIEQEDFVYNDRTTSAAKYGSLKRLTNYSVGAVSPIYKCFRFKQSELPLYWERYFEAGAHEKALSEFVNEGARAGRFNISVDTFLSILVKYPEPAEQQKIADCLGSLDDLIAAHTAKLEALQDHKKGLFQQLFPRKGETRPRLRFPDSKNSGDWKKPTLGSMTIKVGSGITPRGGASNYKMSGRPFMRSQNVGRSTLLLDDVVYIDENTHRSFSGSEIKADDVLLNITGASIGRCAIANTLIAGGNFYQHVCII